MVVRAGKPPTLTGGQKSKSKPSKKIFLGLQGHFSAPPGKRDADEDGQPPEHQRGWADGSISKPRHNQPVLVGVDWLDFTFHPSRLIDEAGPGDRTQAERRASDMDDVPPPASREFMDRVILATSLAIGCDPGDWIELEYGMWGYSLALLGPAGAKVLYAPFKTEENHFHVLLPGQACAMISQAAMISYLNFCDAHEAVCTRVDVKMDDYARVIGVPGIRLATQGGDIVTHAQRGEAVNRWRIGKPETTGDTVYVGAKGSRQLLRAYDKGLESGGEIDAIRWELETRKEPAVTLVARLRSEPWGEVIASRILSFVDFRDATSSSKIEKRTQLEWYARLIGSAKKASAYLPKLPKTIGDLTAWIRQSIGPSLATLFRAWTGDIGPLTEILADGERRLRPKHLAMLARSA